MIKTSDEIEKLYQEREVLVYATIQKNYNSPEFRASHGLDKDDILQFGRMGLLKACQTYDKSRGASFRSHIINNIKWSIEAETLRYSLNNINKKSYEIVNQASMDAPLEGSEYDSLHDIVSADDDSFNESDINHFLEAIEKEISKDISDLIRMRMDGMSYSEIASVLNISKQAVEQRLKRNRGRIIELYRKI